MSEEQSFRISVIDPIEPAIERVKTVLFSPFDIGKWFVIGFCAWLASLSAGGFNFNFNFPFDKRHRYEELPARVHDFITGNLPTAIIIGSVLLVTGVVIFIVLCWLSSRGKFMFLDCVAQNKAEVKNPWRKYRQQGNSLFLFQLAVGMSAFICLIFCVAAGVLAIIAMKIYGVKAMIAFIPLLAGVVVIFILLLLIFWVVFIFTVDFVVPIMYLRGCKCLEGWRQFMGLLSHNKGRFVLYILFQIVIGMAISVIIFAGVCLTCCCACCLLAIPYIGIVCLLPLLVFQRAYSLCYLRQFGSQFDVFTPAANIANSAV